MQLGDELTPVTCTTRTINILVVKLTTPSFSHSDNFMNGLYRMFLGDARPNSERDDWIFMDVDSIQEVIIPAARIALKVHQVSCDVGELCGYQ